MAAFGLPGQARRSHRFQGATAASGIRARPRYQRERRRDAHLETALQDRRSRGHSQSAWPGISPRRSKARLNSSISRRLIFWLAVPLMLLALCGGLIHYFNSVAPGVISSDRRLKGAANALMMHLGVENQRFTLGASPNAKPPLPSPESIDYAVRDSQGRLLLGDAKLAGAALSGS